MPDTIEPEDKPDLEEVIKKEPDDPAGDTKYLPKSIKESEEFSPGSKYYGSDYSGNY